MYLRRMEPHVIFLLKTFSETAAIDGKLDKQESLSHKLGAKKTNLPSGDRGFYNKAYDLLAVVHQDLLANKGRQADFDTLDKLLERLNDESSDKVKLVDDILAFLAPIRHPERLGKTKCANAYTDDDVMQVGEQVYNRRWLYL